MNLRRSAPPALAFLLHAALVFAFVLPPGAVFSNEPLASVDYPLHYYNVASDLESLRSVGTTAGYDPFFMAGFPQGIFDIEVKLPVLLGRLLPERFLPTLFNLWVLTLVLVPPALLAAIGSLLRMGFTETVALLVLGLLQFFLGWPVDLAAIGMVSFLAVSYLALFAWALFVRAAESRSGAASAGLLVACAFGTLVHPFFALVVAPELAFAEAALPREARLRGLWLIGAATLATLATNVPWILPVVARLGETTPCTIFWENRSLLAPLIEYLPSVNGMKLLATGLAVAGVWPSRDRDGEHPSRGVSISLLGAAAALFVFAYYGSFSSVLANLEPTRFLVPFEICLLVPAARGLRRAARAWLPKLKSPPAAILAGLAILVLSRSSLFAPHLHWLVVSRDRTVHGADAHPSFGALVRWIGENTSSGERILIEERAWRREGGKSPTDYLEALLPLLTNRSFIGGPYPWYCLRGGKVGFDRAKPFGRDIASYSPEGFSAALARYAVGWVLAWSPEAVADLERRAGDGTSPGATPSNTALDPSGRIGPYSIFRVPVPASLFLVGSGRVDLGYGRIRLSGVEPGDDGSVVLKLHCDPRLAAPPGMGLACVDVPDDPIGFLRIQGAKGDFEVRVGDEGGHRRSAPSPSSN